MLAGGQPTPPRSPLDLLDYLPWLRARIPDLPDDLQRRLYDAFGLKVHYYPQDHRA
ncbi:MAG: hypothetical protein IRY90_18105 [Actinomadura rubrobrunea]|nr:hypothetical protein [Actinomadura rubrobrunea]